MPTCVYRNTTLSAFSDAVADFIAHNNDDSKISGLSKKVVRHVKSEGFSMPTNLYECLRGVVDYVAGTTDNYATYVAQQIGGLLR